ncbi:multidrug effflux MFS transporter [Massilia sp. IC2-278]|uniref:multidrug effflux MFS transporter n=1 Tax=Massilia sp. IC2-278 TaxID=2887200 RepID=UPI001E329321|nr:multidrug effflux MFS transporter [Massilia sp. IC2-278]MCC2962681.1 multidrug effflux MFS transporter [Massilia sp. IC2-278]
MEAPETGFKLAASLALVTILGPAGIDMYLASMPHMAQELDTSYARVQLTLTVFLLAMGAGQLLFGPIVDAYGRRRPLVLALFVYIAASVGAGFAPSIDALLGARFVQGMAAALTLVVAMSTVRDVCSGTRAAQLFALLMTIEGLAPVLAPAVGGYVDAAHGWRAVMLVLAALGVLALGNTLVNLPETLPQAQRSSLQPGQVSQTYLRIVRDSAFLLPTLALSAAFFFLFAYIGGASLVYQQHYGLASDTFGLVFGATGVAVLLGALGSTRLVARMGVARVATTGVGCMTAGAAIGAAAAGFDAPLAVVAAGMFVAMLGLGIAEATLMSLAMSSQQVALGSTAALLGAFQLMISSAATPVAGAFAESGPVAWLSLLVILGVVALALAMASAARVPAELRELAGH